jgi:hypothetical protein
MEQSLGANPYANWQALASAKGARPRVIGPVPIVSRIRLCLALLPHHCAADHFLRIEELIGIFCGRSERNLRPEASTGISPHLWKSGLKREFGACLRLPLFSYAGCACQA